MELNFRLHFRPTLFLIPVLILSACVSTNNAVLVETSRRAASTPAESPLAAQPTEPQAMEPASAKSPFAARLTVVRSQAKVFTSGGIETEVQQAQSANVQVDNGIEVVKPEGQDEQSYSILSVPDFLNVELFSNT